MKYLLLLSLVGCGEIDRTNAKIDETNDKAILVVEKYLPKELCTENEIGRMAYIQTLKQLYVCQDIIFDDSKPPFITTSPTWIEEKQ